MSAVHSRYRLLDTLRVYGRHRVEAAGADRALAHRHATYYVELAERAAHGLQGPDERAWVDDALADYDNMRAAFVSACADRDADLAVRLVASIPELVHLRIGVRGLGLGRAGTGRGRSRAPALCRRGRCRRTRGMEPRRLPTRPAAGSPGHGPRTQPGTPRIAHPGDVLADVALYEGDVDRALRHYTAEAQRARAEGDRIRLVWTLCYVAICEAVRRAPERGVGPALESLTVADATANPTARRWRATRWAWC